MNSYTIWADLLFVTVSLSFCVCSALLQFLIQPSIHPSIEVAICCDNIIRARFRKCILWCLLSDACCTLWTIFWKIINLFLTADKKLFNHRTAHSYIFTFQTRIKKCKSFRIAYKYLFSENLADVKSFGRNSMWSLSPFAFVCRFVITAGNVHIDRAEISERPYLFWYFPPELWKCARVTWLSNRRNIYLPFLIVRFLWTYQRLPRKQNSKIKFLRWMYYTKFRIVCLYVGIKRIKQMPNAKCWMSNIKWTRVTLNWNRNK